MTGSLNLRPISQPNNRYIVGLKDRLTQKDDLDFLKDQGFKHLETFEFPEESFPDFGGDLILVEAENTTQAEKAIRKLAENPEVEYAEPDTEFEVDLEKSEYTSPPNRLNEETRTPDDLSSSLWGLDNRRDTDIDAPEAWTKTTGSRTGPIIAVLDTGVDLTHPDLQDNLWTNTGEIPGNGKDDDGNGVVDDVHGYNAYYENGDPTDTNDHGTHCAGTIGAVGNNGKGVVGVNWQTRIMPVKIFNNNEDKPKTSNSAILRGISYATRNGARITSNSWGGGWFSFSVKRAFSRSSAFHVMAAGNDSKNNDEDSYYPANYDMDNSIAVASIDRWGDLSSFSNYGKEEVDLAAPGSSIYSTIRNGRYGYMSGTSMATPHTSGVAGLAATLNPELTNSELKEVLMAGVDESDKLTDKVASGGRLNAHKTLLEAEKR